MPSPGTPVITLSASNSHFASYLVTLDSITFETDNGAFYTPVFQPVVMDLARLKDYSEILTAAPLPAGNYVNAAITIDYTNSRIYADDNGTPVGLAPQAPGAVPISTAVVTVTFDPAHPLVVTNPVSTVTHLAFDLEAFNTIHVTSPATCTIQPYVVMKPASADGSPQRARGVFVVTQEGNFIMNVRPFYDYSGSPSGALTVNVSDKTYFNVNGTIATGGTAGLPLMKPLNISSPVVAYGTLDNLSTITPTFNATAVYAGDTLEGAVQDHFVGVVAARSGNTLTLHNIQWLPLQSFNYLAPMGFFPTATVTVGADTLVTEDGVEKSGLGLQSISVGQQVDIGGLCTLAGVPCIAAASGTAVLMDATAGQVRLLSTRAWGVVNAATPNSATLDLLTLGDFNPASYKFAGTASGGGAVNPAAYLVNTGTIDESGTAAATFVAVDGIVAPFGSAPPDFNATAVTHASATEQNLVVEWNGGTTAPFSEHDANGLVVNLANPAIDTVHDIYTGPQAINLKALPANPLSPLITTTGADQSKLLLAVGNATLGVAVFQGAAAFTTKLNTDLNGTNKVYRLAAYGQYNSAANTFVATRIEVSLQN